MSLSQWQLNGSCLPLLCSSCLHLEVHSAGKSEKKSNIRGKIHAVLYVTKHPFPQVC